MRMRRWAGRGPVFPLQVAMSLMAMTVTTVLGQELSMGMPVGKRVANRTFPSVFQAWNPADNMKEDALATAARHDLLFHGAGFFGLQWNDPNEGLATGFTPQSVQRALLRRRALLGRNPQLVLLMEIRYRDAHRSYLPEGHPWWRRDKAGNLAMGWAEGGYIQLDFSKPEYRNQVAIQAKAAVDSGVVEGIMLDWWQDDDARLALIRSVRERVGEDALISRDVFCGHLDGQQMGVLGGGDVRGLDRLWGKPKTKHHVEQLFRLSLRSHLDGH